MPLHRADQAHQRLAGHQAVSIQDQELRVGAAETPHPLGDIAGFARDILPAPPIEDLRLCAYALAERQVSGLLGNPDIGIGGVAEDENVERAVRFNLVQRFTDRLQRGQDPCGLLVVGRHQERGAGGKTRQFRAWCGAERGAAAGEHREEAGERAGERQGDPGEQREEHRQHEDRQRGNPVHREHAVHLLCADDRHDGSRADNQKAAQCHAARRTGRMRGRARRRSQRLGRHVERRFVGQRAKPFGVCGHAVQR